MMYSQKYCRDCILPTEVQKVKIFDESLFVMNNYTRTYVERIYEILKAF